MSTKQPRQSLPPSSPTMQSSKLPKFLQKQTRDRSRSVTDPSGRSSPTGSSFSTPNPATTMPTSDSTKSRPLTRKTSKLHGVKEHNEHPIRSHDRDRDNGDDSMDDPPVIVEPVNVPRPRTRSERPLSASSDNHLSSGYYSSSSSSRLYDLPTRLSGWLSHTFSTSSTDLSLPNLLSQSQSASPASSPKSRGAALLAAAKHGKTHFNTAMSRILDSDATPDKCTDPIWLLGVLHPGYEPPPPPSASPPLPTGSARRSSIDSRRSPPSLRSSSSTSSHTANPPPDPSLSTSQSSKHPGSNWPPVFYADFTSRIWLTYRSQFVAIKDGDLLSLEDDPVSSSEQASVSPQSKKWNWPGGSEKGWTSDSGWGCMLRTGQSLLANTLIHLHLGRDWRRPPHPIRTADYATYVQILTWFLDSPSPLCPFSVHRMALAGKALGTDVGQWFGPSTAAGAIKNLMSVFPEAGLGIAVAVDGVVYQSDVFVASNMNVLGSPKRHIRSGWGSRAVLILIGIRLGIEGVNPVYYDTIKTLFTFPQSVGIAGGRPRSSYYFVGSQADNLFYLDPHHARPTIPLRSPPTNEALPLPSRDRWERQSTPDSGSDRDPDRDREKDPQTRSPPYHHRSPTSPSSIRTGSSTFSYHAPMSPSPLQQQFSTSSSSRNSSSAGQDSDLSPVQDHYVVAYSLAELRTFHCERVRKMQLSGLDPSMLIGFLCKDENDWVDLQKRVAELPRAIFAIQDEPPSWPSDSDDLGLESISDPDMDDMPEDDLYDARSTSAPASSRGKSSELETEDDPIDPVTPGPHSRSSFPNEKAGSKKFGDTVLIEDDDDEWVEPSPPTPDVPPVPHPRQQTQTLPIRTNGSHSMKVKKTAVPVPFVRSSSESERYQRQQQQQQQQHFPFPVSRDDESELDNEVSAAAENLRGSRLGKRQGQPRATRARDGGRTQSGGVRGVPYDDGDYM